MAVSTTPSGALVAAALCLALACGEAPPSAAAPGEPLRLRVEVLAAYPHRADAFTQGLLLHDGRLYESTGQYGQSSLRRVDPKTGEVERQVRLADELFGEGLARVGGRLFQLTWREGRALVWDIESLEPRGELAYEGEGWGLCFDGTHLVRSDGTDTLTFHAPEDFRTARRLRVALGDRPVPRLNELECAEGSIYANVWGEEAILRIDPANGRVLAVIDASGLLASSERRGTDVLNGIAHDAERGTFLLTGKNWPRLFEVVFVPAAGARKDG